MRFCAKSKRRSIAYSRGPFGVATEENLPVPRNPECLGGLLSWPADRADYRAHCCFPFVLVARFTSAEALMSLLISVLITFVVVVLVLYLVNLLPVDRRARQIVRVIVIIIG